MLIPRENVDGHSDAADSGGTHGKEPNGFGVSTSLANQGPGIVLVADDFEMVEPVALGSVNRDLVWIVDEQPRYGADHILDFDDRFVFTGPVYVRQFFCPLCQHPPPFDPILC